MLRSFLSAFWKTILALIILAAIATVTMAQPAASHASVTALRDHVRAIASHEHNTATPAQLEKAARYFETTLSAQGYAVRRRQYSHGGHTVRNIEVSVSHLSANHTLRRVRIVGAHYDSAPGAPGANDNGSGAAALLELTRELHSLRPATGTELKFVFFVNEAPPWFMGEGMGSMQHARALKEAGQNVSAVLILKTIGYYTGAPNSQRYPAGLEKLYPSTGNFIAFVGTTRSAPLVQRTLAAFRAATPFPAEGLAAPAGTPGVTLSDHAAYERCGYPAIMITDTAFMRYPCYHTRDDTPNKLDKLD